MGTRERILAIRLMEKLQTHPQYAKALGIRIESQRPATAEDKKEK